MNFVKYLARADYDISSDSLPLYVVREDGQHRMLLKPATFLDLRSTTTAPREPFIGGEETRAFLQAMMDLGWHQFRIRPANVENIDGKIDVMRAHLNDMRAIVGKKLGVTLP